MADPELQLHFIFTPDSITSMEKYKTGGVSTGIVKGYLLLLAIMGFFKCALKKSRKITLCI